MAAVVAPACLVPSLPCVSPFKGPEIPYIQPELKEKAIPAWEQWMRGLRAGDDDLPEDTSTPQPMLSGSGPRDRRSYNFPTRPVPRRLNEYPKTVGQYDRLTEREAWALCTSSTALGLTRDQILGISCLSINETVVTTNINEPEDITERHGVPEREDIKKPEDLNEREGITGSRGIEAGDSTEDKEAADVKQSNASYFTAHLKSPVGHSTATSDDVPFARAKQPLTRRMTTADCGMTAKDSYDLAPPPRLRKRRLTIMGTAVLWSRTDGYDPAKDARNREFERMEERKKNVATRSNRASRASSKDRFGQSPMQTIPEAFEDQDSYFPRLLGEDDRR